MEEVWKSLKGLVMCGDFYEVSSLGKVRSIARVITDSIGRTKVKKGRELKPRVLKSGHLRVALCKDTMQKDFLVHRLVALAFIPNPENMPCINHKDECPSNNKKDNLEWCDRAYNNNYGTRNDRISKALKDIKIHTSRGGVLVKKLETEELLYFSSITELADNSLSTLGFKLSLGTISQRANNWNNSKGKPFDSGHVITRGTFHYEIRYLDDLEEDNL